MVSATGEPGLIHRASSLVARWHIDAHIWARLHRQYTGSAINSARFDAAKRRIGNALRRNGLNANRCQCTVVLPFRPWWSVTNHMFSSSLAGDGDWRSRSASVTVSPNRLVAPVSSVCRS